MDYTQLFEKARLDEFSRYYFLNQVYVQSSSICDYVNKIVYHSIDICNSTMFVIPSLLAQDWCIPFTKSTIVVCPASFTGSASVSTADDFLSLLEDHELFHAKRFYWRPWSFKRKNEPSEEYLALHNQILHFPFRNCSAVFQETIHAAHSYFENELEFK